jgi:hypothetical protein
MEEILGGERKPSVVVHVQFLPQSRLERLRTRAPRCEDGRPWWSDGFLLRQEGCYDIGFNHADVLGIEAFLDVSSAIA